MPSLAHRTLWLMINNSFASSPLGPRMTLSICHRHANAAFNSPAMSGRAMITKSSPWTIAANRPCAGNVHREYAPASMPIWCIAFCTSACHARAACLVLHIALINSPHCFGASWPTSSGGNSAETSFIYARAEVRAMHVDMYDDGVVAPPCSLIARARARAWRLRPPPLS